MWKTLLLGNLTQELEIGRFVGYDSESKGYWIYWPNKRSVMVEHNVIFNEDNVLTKSDHITIPGMFCLRGRGIRSSSTLRTNNNPDEGEPQNAPN